MYSDLFWFDVGLIVSAISCNPLLSYVEIILFYAVMFRKSDLLSLVGAFGGVSMGLWLREAFQWRPYWSKNQGSIVAHSAVVLFFSAQLLKVFNVEAYFNLYICISSLVFLWPHKRFMYRLTTTPLFLLAWRLWERFYPVYFTEFLRVYVLCAVPFILLILKSLWPMVVGSHTEGEKEKEEKKSN